MGSLEKLNKKLHEEKFTTVAVFPQSAHAKNE